MTAIDRLRAELPDSLLASHAEHAEETVVLRPELALEAFAFLREDLDSAFEMLVDLTAVDHAGRHGDEPAARFEVVYHLVSLARGCRLRVKVALAEGEEEVDSVVSLWPSADWMEREVFDLYGIRFRGHPNLRRILLAPEFEGHPLRKDFPKGGPDPTGEATVS